MNKVRRVMLLLLQRRMILLLLSIPATAVASTEDATPNNAAAVVSMEDATPPNNDVAVASTEEATHKDDGTAAAVSMDIDHTNKVEEERTKSPTKDIEPVIVLALEKLAKGPRNIAGANAERFIGAEKQYNR